MKGINNTWQMDLIDMQKLSKTNKNYKYILAIIDIFSKFAYALPVKSKKGDEIALSLDNLLSKLMIKPKKIHSDQGREFFNKHVSNILKKYGIELYHTFSSQKAYICERFIRTFKRLIYMNMKFRSSLRYIDTLPEMIHHYNYKMKHRTIGMFPGKVTKSDEQRLLNEKYSYPNLCKTGIHHLNEGDVVRISKQRSVFHKGYNLNWTTELFTISNVHNTCPVTYSLVDENGERIQGKFYRYEIQKTAFPDTYLVEKVIKKKGSKMYVKWLGMNSRSWIDKNKVIT